jgi:hypothetical protein
MVAYLQRLPKRESSKVMQACDPESFAWLPLALRSSLD